MKKTQNGLNGFALDPIVPDLPYPSEAVADSDGRRPKLVASFGAQSLGTSLERPSETASEDSSSLKRNPVALAADSERDTLNSAATFPTENLSRDERSKLRKRIKLELDQVRSLSLKLENRVLQLKGQAQPDPLKECANDVPTSRFGTGSSLPKSLNESAVPAVESSSLEVQPKTRPSLVIPQNNQETRGPGGKDKRTPKANQLYLNSEFISGKEKLSPVEKSNTKAGVKRSSQGKLDFRDPKRPNLDLAQSKKMDELMKQCGVALKRLMTHKYSWVFNEPVDVVKLGLHDYLKIIQKPMDLGTIKKKLDVGVYMLPTEFAEDVRLTFANAMKYNPPGHDVYLMADTLRQGFEDKWKSVEEKYQALTAVRATLPKEEPRPAELLCTSSQEVNRAPPVDAKTSSARKPKPTPSARATLKPKTKSVTLAKRPMTFQEKQSLSRNLESLPVDKLEQIVQIIRSKEPSFTQTDDEIEVDIDSFNAETLWELHRFVAECNKAKGKSKKPTEKSSQMDVTTAASEKQLCNGDSKTPKDLKKCGERGEEDVDIGDAMPSGEFPPVLIDKDGGVGSKNSSSSSSSSGSGSSSSDSDSGSSSGSDSDADDAQSAGDVAKVLPADKEPVGSGAVGDRRDSTALEVDGAKKSLSDLDEEMVPAKADVSGSNSHLEAEGHVPGSEPFHERRLRAALLKNRFADTILKAQEKTLPFHKSDRIDPEQLRKEREELERRQKEEKARLQAEAKAAELARKRADAEAAAEARRRREAEREAARVLLQNMEKTVEIDENSEILKDLERFGSAPPEHIPSPGDEANLVHPDGLSAFHLQGGNPLEQLGLFMKGDDDDEEHDIEPVLIQGDNPAGDEDEEGEIED